MASNGRTSAPAGLQPGAVGPAPDPSRAASLGPKRRRLPTDIGEFTHRAVALLFSDGRVSIESADVKDLATSMEPFDSPVSVAICIFGNAPPTAYGSADAAPDADRPPATAAWEAAEREAETVPDGPAPWRPQGSKDISFPGAALKEVPEDVRQQLARLHQ